MLCQSMSDRENVGGRHAVGRVNQNMSAAWKYNETWITGANGIKSEEGRHQRREIQGERITKMQLFSRKIVGHFFRKLK